MNIFTVFQVPTLALQKDNALNSFQANMKFLLTICNTHQIDLEDSKK